MYADVGISQSLPIQKGNDNRDESSSTSTHISSENSPRKRKLRAKIIKLKVQNKTLRETIRRLWKEKQKTRPENASTKEEVNEYKTLRELGSVKLNSLPLIERHCILCADEMSLKAHLFYNVSRDEIIGFEDTDNNKSPISAKNALVIMARSIAGNWKVPVCYCFVETACSSKILKNLIFDIIIKLTNNGANKVHALVTDMGSNFILLSRELGISTENSTFLVEKEKIHYIFDTPHLIKATRNNLLKHNFKINNKIASWTHIVDFYKRDSKQWIKAAPKLSNSHIESNNFLRMKVKYAVQIFNNHVAAGMCTQISSGFLVKDLHL